MKKKFTFLMMTCLMVLFGTVKAQDVSVIGDGGTSYSSGIPVAYYYTKSISQLIYTQAEINHGAAVITSIAFKQQSATTGTERDIVVFMKNTTKESFSGNKDWESLSESDKVYEGKFTTIGADQWVTITLPTPFAYTGGNLLISVWDNTGTGGMNDQFYTFSTGSSIKRAIYYYDMFGNGSINPYDLSSKTGSFDYSGWGNNADYKNSQIQITFGAAAAASIEVTPAEFDLGETMLGNYWMENKPSQEVSIKTTNTSVTSVTSNNTFFTVPNNIDFTTNPVVFNVGYDVNATAGEKTGVLTITYGDGETETVNMTATAYTPSEGDVWELAKKVTAYPYEETPAYANIHANYNLPGDGDAGKDVVYELNFTSDVTLTASVEGANAKLAVYQEDFGGQGGPKADNNYEGVQNDNGGGSSAPTTFGPYTFSDMTLEDIFTINDADGDGYKWHIYAYGLNGGPSLCSESYISNVGVLTPNNYIVTKQQYYITADSKLQFVYQSTYVEKFAVEVSTDGESFESVWVETNNTGDVIKTADISLSKYAGQSVYIALRHYECSDGLRLLIDNLALTDGSAKTRAGENQIDGVQFPAGKYYLVASATEEFTVNIATDEVPAPVAATLISPENDATEQDNPKLTWNLGNYTSEYRLMLGTDAENLNAVVDWTSTLATEYQTAELLDGTKYFWRVDAKNSTGETSSEVWSFVTPLEVPVITSETAFNLYPEGTATLTWNAITVATSYKVYNGEDLYATVTETQCEISGLAYNMEGHEFAVVAVSALGESQKSTVTVVKVTGNVTVQGTVTDGTNPLNGAAVAVVGLDEFGTEQTYSFTSDENGTFSGSVLAGAYTATITRYDYKEVEKEFDAIHGETPAVNVAMSEAPEAAFDVTAAESGDNANVTWNASYTKYNVYRKEIATGEVEKIASDLTAKQYQDTDWASLENGQYQYGVSTMVESVENNTEGFEGGVIPYGWTTSNNTATYPSNADWQVIQTDNSPESKYSAYSYMYWSSDSEKYYLVSPMINIDGVQDPKVTFKYRTYSIYGSSYRNTLTVNISTSPTGPWTQVWTNNGTYTGTNWVSDEANLNTSLGTEIYVAFATTIKYCQSYVDDVVLPNAMKSESKVNWSNVLVKGGIAFTGEGNWNDVNNWADGNIPSTDSDVIIEGNATIAGDVTVASIIINEGASLTVESGVLTVTEGIVNADATAFVINDGAQVFQNADDVSATFNMNIVTPEAWATDHSKGWQFISSPVKNAKTSDFKSEEGDFDLFKYDGSKDEEWVNYKGHQLVGDSFFYDFADGMQGWTSIDANADNHTWGHTEDGTGSNFEYGTAGGFNPDNYDDPFNTTYNSVKGALFNDAYYTSQSTNWQIEYFNPDDYVVSPKKVMLVDDSQLKFYLRNSSNNTNNEVSVFISEDDVVSKDNLTLVHTVATASQYWYQVNVSLGAYVGKDVWIVIRHNANESLASYVLIDNIELTNGTTTRSAGGETFELVFQQGRGYLASYETETTATFAGTVNSANSFTFEEVNAYEAGSYANFYLLGNPFTFNMNWANVTLNNVYNGFATVGANGSYVYSNVSEVTEIPVGDGFFVMTTGSEPSMSYTHAASKGTRGVDANSINIIASGESGYDNVVIRLAGYETEGFTKIDNFNKEIAEVYVENFGNRYGIMSYDENTTEVEVSFHANQMGNYTIAAVPSGKFQTLTLVDRFTGIETNLLIEDYHFIATSSEDVNRFIVKLAVSGQQSAVSDNFVYQSGEELIVDAEGTVQIIDVIGRVVYSDDVESTNNRIDVSEFRNGTYMVRVINGSEVKVEKVVIY